jgi:ribosomal protein S18 acetylase RimI-like enzyme
MIEPESVLVRNTTPDDFSGIVQICAQVYPGAPAWTPELLGSHLAVFPEGQFVAVDRSSRSIVGMSASLIVLWDDYSMETSWRDFTSQGTFLNHDPAHGRTLYGAEVMVHPGMQGRGIGKRLYRARRELTESLRLLRIRAGARLRGYHKHASSLDAESYVRAVVASELRDPTLSFQLGQGFHVLAVVQGYLRHDPESLGHAAVIEWINRRVALPEDYVGAREFLSASAFTGTATLSPD